MIAEVKSAGLTGMESIDINVEVEESLGLPDFNVIGLGDMAVKEASERVRSALINSDIDYPKGKITVNLSPAWIRKKGTHYDMAMAVGVMISTGYVSLNSIKEAAFIGELSLTGDFIPVKGVLPMIAGLKGKVKEIYLPYENSKEGVLASKGMDIDIISVSNLRQLARILKSDEEKIPYEFDAKEIFQPTEIDFIDVKGNQMAKDAIVTAVSGGHGLLLIGSPGTGKTILSKRIPTILPDMSEREKIETSMVYSLIGGLTNENPIIYERPFREINKRTTEVGILGGGNDPIPGEISLANNGILFVDELLEFPREKIETLRKPIEDKEVVIYRRGEVFKFPANFTLIAATNPCRCGYYGDKEKKCKCTQTEIDKYRNKLSGPICERLDIAIDIPRIDYLELNSNEVTMSSKEMKEKVINARKIQEERFKGLEITLNSEMNETNILEFCPLGKEESEYLKLVYKKFNLSPRRYHKILKLARTIADLNGKENIDVPALSLAVNYTRFLNNDKENGGSF